MNKCTLQHYETEEAAKLVQAALKARDGIVTARQFAWRCKAWHIQAVR